VVQPHTMVFNNKLLITVPTNLSLPFILFRFSLIRTISYCNHYVFFFSNIKELLSCQIRYSNLFNDIENCFKCFSSYTPHFYNSPIIYKQISIYSFDQRYKWKDNYVAEKSIERIGIYSGSRAVAYL